MLNKPGIRVYVIIPLLINFLLFAAAIWFAVDQIGTIVTWFESKLPEALQWLSWIVWPIFILIACLLIFFCFSLLANIVGAPFNSYLSSAVERYLTGITPNSNSESNFFIEFFPTIISEIKKIAYFILYSIPFIVLFFIPVVQIAAPFLWFIFSSWILIREYMDYPLSNHDKKFHQQRQILKQHKIATLSLGSVLSIATLTPVANFLVMPASVAAATLLYVEKFSSHHSTTK